MVQEGNWCPKDAEECVTYCSLHVRGDSTLNTDTTTRHPVDAIQHMLVNPRKRSRR
jgi:hypothetical protein